MPATGYSTYCHSGKSSSDAAMPAAVPYVQHRSWRKRTSVAGSNRRLWLCVPDRNRLILLTPLGIGIDPHNPVLLEHLHGDPILPFGLDADIGQGFLNTTIWHPLIRGSLPIAGRPNCLAPLTTTATLWAAMFCTQCRPRRNRKAKSSPPALLLEIEPWSRLLRKRDTRRTRLAVDAG